MLPVKSWQAVMNSSHPCLVENLSESYAINLLSYKMLNTNISDALIMKSGFTDDGQVLHRI